MKTFELPGHEPSLVPQSGNWKLVFHDEFDGDTLDLSKWSFRRHLYHQKNEGYIGEEGVFLDGESHLVFRQIERDGKYYSSQLQTGENWHDRPSASPEWQVAKFSEPKYLHRYGFYEARVRLQRGSNWWSAFWLQAPYIGTQPDEKKVGVEVDIMESFFGNTYIPHFIHWGGYGADHRYATTLEPKRGARAEDSIPLDDGFHRFGCLWEPDGYTFFVDGVQSGRKLTEAVSRTEQFILIGTECVGYRPYTMGIYRDTGCTPYPNDCFVVDYVRVFDPIEA